MIWFPFYPSDFIGATVALSCQEVSIYNWMLTLYYQLGPFPEDRVRTYRIIRCESDEQKRTVDYILNTRFVLLEGFWWNQRAEREREQIERRHAEASLRGKLSVEARKSKYGTAQPSPRKAIESVSKASGNASELTTTTTTYIKTKEYAPAVPSGVSDQVWQDFLRCRRALRAPVTSTALKGIQREAVKAGISMEAALQICVERGWRGFKAEWLLPKPGAKPLEEAKPWHKSASGIKEKAKELGIDEGRFDGDWLAFREAVYKEAGVTA